MQALNSFRYDVHDKAMTMSCVTHQVQSLSISP